MPADLTTDVEDQLDNLQTENDDLRDQLSDLTEERDQLKAEVEKLTQKVEDATHLANELVRELTRD
ncbi:MULTISPECIES: hypothetical protein [Streptomyces]|uniref:hypothetical protein n=1 Tax=Streptomyces TaxID=1883 RepID=UPI002244E183|nr:hypothetical protein [Streptomyces griseolus]MCW8219442.1 hypothetical protein [Streptomyces griseolus]